jgi:AbrB family looped-hinge helix DNA binding protein
MSTVMKISPQGQVRIPKKIMGKLGLGKGDYVEVEIIQNEIVLKPRKLIDPSQGWYWTAINLASDSRRNICHCPRRFSRLLMTNCSFFCMTCPIPP